MASQYDYKELREKAVSNNATQEDINALGEWFEQNGYSHYWNGECFDAEGYYLYPIHKQISEEQFEIVGYELR